MDYWKQRRAYRSLKLIKLHVSAGQNNLYRELLDYANDENELDNWFEIKNEALASLTGLSDRGMKEARNALVQSGLIEYKPGKRSTANPQYQIKQLYHTASRSTSNSASASTETVPQVVPQSVPQVVPPSTYTTTGQDHTNKKPSRQKSAPRTFAEDSEEYKSAVHLWGRIQNNNPDAKAPELQKWSDELRLMHERDNRPWDKINRMIDWCQDDDFWQANILSPAKLRKQYDQMAAKANANAKQSKRSYGRPHRQEDTPDWMQPGYKPESKAMTPEDRAKMQADLDWLRANKETKANGI